MTIEPLSDEDWARIRGNAYGDDYCAFLWNEYGDQLVARIDALQARLALAEKVIDAAAPIVADRAAGGRMLTPVERAAEVQGMISAYKAALSIEKAD